ncbi:MAG: ShlB/FhaC/HecB family hemolysin secretion/activation protein, partial [Phenylobacterium sp.]
AVEVFDFEDTLSEASASYRFALSNLTGAVTAPGDAWLGLEARRQVSVAAFGEVRISSGAFNAYHFVAGYNRTRFDPQSQTEFEAVLRLSPGDLGDANSPERLAEVSQGRASQARYAYASLSLAHARAFSGGSVVRALVRAQVATDALPRSELFGLGGPTAARGYTHDDGASDQGLLFQGDLEFPEVPISDGAVTLQPSLIADGSWGRSKGGGPETGLADIGIGAMARLPGRAELQATLAGALLDGPRTQAGDIRAVARFTVRF